MSLGSDSASQADVEQLDAVPGPGALVAGKYKVERTIGVGGMGVVMAARHTQLNHLVAIKFLNEKTTQSVTGTARFLREARASAALRSEHVARVFDVGTLDSGAPFMVMEYLEGKSLSKLIRKRAPLPVYQSVDLVLQACDALREAHEHGIIHRDVKPSNLFLTKRTDGSTLLKVLDFGISKAPTLADEGEPTLTDSYMVLGSPQYLSPEQIIDVRSVDQRTDVWALGVVLYYMLAGVRPFEEETVAALCVAIATKTPARLLDHRPDVSPELDAVVMRCLEKDRQHRMPSVMELQRELAPFSSMGTRTYLDALDGPPSRQDPPSNVRTFSPEVPSSARPAAAAASADGAPVLAALDLALPMAPTELMVRPRESQNSIVAVQTRPRSSSPALPIAAGVALVALVVLFVVTREPSTPAEDVGVVAAPPAAAEPAPEATSEVPEGRTPMLRGSAIHRPPQPPPPASKPKRDLSKVIPPGTITTANAELMLFDRVGGQRVLAVVPKGDVVKVLSYEGEWAHVIHVSKKPVSGWTPRNLVQ